MLTVYKYPVKFDDYFRVELPIGSKPLKVDLQSNSIVLWALVDSEAKKEDRYFRLAGTGHKIGIETENLKYINTFETNCGTFVWHVFEILRK